MKTFTVVNPARLTEVVGDVPMQSEADVDMAIQAATTAFAGWSRTAIDERAAMLSGAAEELAGCVPELATLFVRENGKPLREAERDIRRSIELMEVVADELPLWWKPELYDAGQPVWARRRARGVTAVISPWNSPVLLSFKRFVPAIAAGNTVVIKPATFCPLTVQRCVEIVRKHLPPGVIHLVTGSGATVGEMLASDARIRTVAFTGSSETGRRIMQTAAATLKKLFLELGGNDAAIIAEDAALDAAAMQRITNAILRAAGQVCVAIKRIYVHRSRYDEFVAKLEASFDEVVVGDGLDPNTTMGPLNNRSQFDFVTTLLKDSRSQGLHVITKGRQLNPADWDGGYFMLPSIVLGATEQHQVVSCEQFGPVVPVMPFSGEDDAIAAANASEYGLRASIWTADEERAAAIADRLAAGAVFHNNHGIFRDLRLEFPGIKQSGLGGESRRAALDHYADTYGFAG
jgi:acyl-CoA reductase-like NAD-dependent aldehyde dehydrogenase